MGALRAAELHAFGMVGVGSVFEAYREGACEDDDEVVVMHAGQEFGFGALSEAMVNIRDGLSQALKRRVISQLTHDTVAREIKHCHYSQRTWRLVPEIAKNECLPLEEVDALIEFVKTERPNRKRLDAIELLNQLRPFEEVPPPPFEPKFEFESTVFWDQLVAGTRTAPGPRAAVPIEAIRSHLGIAEDDAEEIFQGALLLYLVVKEAHRVGLHADPEKVAAVSERFRQSHGLATAAATEEWLRRNHLGEAEFPALMEVIALVEAVAKHHSSGLDAFLPAELQRRGRFEGVVAAIGEKRGALANFGNTFPSAEDVGTTTDELLTWYETRFRSLGNSLDDHFRVRRFSEGTRFVREIISEYIREGRHVKTPSQDAGECAS